MVCTDWTGIQSDSVDNLMTNFQGNKLEILIFHFFAPRLASWTKQKKFKKGWHHPSGSFIYWAHVTSLACKANVQSTNTYHTWIDIVYTNHKRKGTCLMRIPHWKVFAGTQFKTFDLLTQIFFDLQPYHPYMIWPFFMAPHGRLRISLELHQNNQCFLKTNE